jgi:hypothetical protein
VRPISFSFPTFTQNEICATQTTTATSQGLVINGSLSNINIQNTQGYSPQALAVGIQRPVAIFSTGNISTSTFTISGFDCRATGLLSTTIAGPTGTLVGFVQTVTEFNKVIAVSVGTLASSSLTVGFGPSGSTNWVNLDKNIAPFNVAISVVVSTGTPVTIQDTPLDLNQVAPAAAFTFNHATLATVTVSAQNSYTVPVNYARAICTATLNTASSALATSTPAITFIQAGSGA